MKTIIIGAVARNGVIGRTSKVCDGYPLLDGIITEHRECHGGEIHRTGPPGTYGLAVDDCPVCNGTGRIPCNDIPWNYPELETHLRKQVAGRPCLIGHNTFKQGLLKPLLAQSPLYVISADRSVEAALAVCACCEQDTAMVVGGARLFETALPLATHLDLTLIDHDHAGDVKFPYGTAWHRADRIDFDMWEPQGVPNDKPKFECIERRQGETPELTFTRWERIR